MVGEMKQAVEKIKRKKWGKEEWIILILAGIFLLIVFFPNTEKNEEKNKLPDSKESIIQSEKEEEGKTYKEQTEKQLAEVLKSIDGIDSVKVMITLQTSEEDVVLRETKMTQENTTEQDSQGGLREIESSGVEESVCYGTENGEESGPYVTHTIAPKVEGVLIVVGGAKAGSLRTQIVKAVQALFDVESHKVVVIKMKES